MAKRGLSNKRVIVTGASSGIGWHLAKQLAAEGCSVVASARRADRLDQLSSEIENEGGKCLTVVGDVTESESADRLRSVFEVNFFAVTELIRLSLPELKKGNDPIIVNVSSVLGHRAAPLKSEYCASKFALHGFSDSIRAELTQDNIDLLLVSPSTTDSEFFDASIEDQTKKNWKERGAMPPEVVAAKTIRAIKKGKHEIILTHGGRFIVWMDRLIPGIANRLMAKFGQ